MKYLFAIPGAGAGPREFTDWQKNLGDEIIFRKALYNKGLTKPGAHCETMQEAAASCAAEIMRSASAEDEIYLFGHCMGASIAYETASLIAREYGLRIKGLFFAAFISPDVPVRDGISGLDDNAFIDEIHSHGTFPEEFFANRSIMKLFIPGIRADYKLIEEYCDTDHYVLDCPICGFFGEDDDMVIPEETRGWADYTSSTYRSVYFPGDHYFYYDRQSEIACMIRDMILRQRETAINTGGTMHMEETIKELLAETVNADPAAVKWDSDTDIINDIGIDSLQIVRFLMSLEDRIGISLDYDQLSFDDFSSIRALADFIRRQM